MNTRPFHPTPIEDEHRRMRRLRLLVDFTAQLIMQSRMSREEAERVVESMRLQVLQLFPGKDTTYEIVYRRRFERLISEFAHDGETLLH